MKLELPIPLNIANARLHWAMKLRAKNKYYLELDNLKLLGLLPVPETPLERVNLAAHFRVHNRMDHDNLEHRMKWVLDWLVTRGYLVDDNPSVIIESEITQEINRKDKGLAITIEAL